MEATVETSLCPSAIPTLDSHLAAIGVKEQDATSAAADSNSNAFSNGTDKISRGSVLSFLLECDEEPIASGIPLKSFGEEKEKESIGASPLSDVEALPYVSSPSYLGAWSSTTANDSSASDPFSYSKISDCSSPEFKREQQGRRRSVLPPCRNLKGAGTLTAPVVADTCKPGVSPWPPKEEAVATSERRFTTRCSGEHPRSRGDEEKAAPSKVRKIAEATAAEGQKPKKTLPFPGMQGDLSRYALRDVAEALKAPRRSAPSSRRSSSFEDAKEAISQEEAPAFLAATPNDPLKESARFAILRKLGSGYTSTVYGVLDLRTNEEVAVKVSPKQQLRVIVSDAYYRSLYRHIFRAPHPNLIRIVNFAEDHTHYKIATELCEGPDLVEFVLNFGPGTIPINLTTSIVRQILLGLDHLHHNGMLHRDVKLDNILFKDPVPLSLLPVKKSDNEGSPNAVASAWCQMSCEMPLVKLIDFDMALRIGKPDTARQSLKENEVLVVGTKDYMAPECYRGEYSEASDLWSVGVILFIFLDGHFPFDFSGCDGQHKKIRAVLHEGVTLRPEIAREHPLAVDLLRRLLAFDVKDRIREAADALAHPFFAGAALESRRRRKTTGSSLGSRTPHRTTLAGVRAVCGLPKPSTDDFEVLKQPRRSSLIPLTNPGSAEHTSPPFQPVGACRNKVSSSSSSHKSRLRAIKRSMLSRAAHFRLPEIQPRKLREPPPVAVTPSGSSGGVQACRGGLQRQSKKFSGGQTLHLAPRPRRCADGLDSRKKGKKIGGFASARAASLDHPSHWRVAAAVTADLQGVAPIVIS